MSEQWEFVPVWKPAANRKGIVGELEVDDGAGGSDYEYSTVSLERAAEVVTELRALAQRFEDDDPVVLGWAIGNMADDIEKAVTEATKGAK